jgi:hypothetical protein
MFRSLKSLLLTLGLLGWAGGVAASTLHIDVNVSLSAGKLQIGFCGNPTTACDVLPVLTALGVSGATLPLDHATGKPIFVTDFGDFAGGPFAVDSPGFFSRAGRLPGNLLLNYQAMGSLRYWNPDQDRWLSSTPGDERIRLFGGLDATTVLSTDTSHCGGLLLCIPREIRSTVYEEGSTLFTDTGFEGARSLIVGRTAANGSLHVHLDWFLERPNGTRGGAAGAYLLEMRMTAAGYTASDPFFIMFKRGISDAEFGRALAARIFAPSGGSIPPGGTGGTGGSTGGGVGGGVSAVPLPAGWVLFLSATVLGVGARRRRTSARDTAAR